MNIECHQETLDELANAFRFNDAVIRNLIIRREEAITEPSPLLKAKDIEETGSRPRAETQEPVDDDARGAEDEVNGGEPQPIAAS
jgi:small subunit ribosomal protein S6